MPAEIKIDQVGLPATPVGKSRSDGLAGGDLVTLSSSGGGLTHKFQFLWVPDGDVNAVASLTPTVDPAVWTFSPTPAIYGSYRVELITDEGLSTEDRQIRLFSIRTPNASLRIPALNERGDPRASLILNGVPEIDASEDNENAPSGVFASGNYGGYYRSLVELYDAVESGAGGGGAPSGPAGGQLSGTYPNPSVAGLTETSGPTALTVGAVADGEVLVRSGSTIVGQSAGSGGVDVSIHDQQTGTTAKLVGAVRLASGNLTTASRVLLGTASGGTATLELRQFGTATVVATFPATGAVQDVVLASAASVPADDWYQIYLFGDAAGTISLVEGLHLEQ